MFIFFKEILLKKFNKSKKYLKNILIYLKTHRILVKIERKIEKEHMHKNDKLTFNLQN